VNAGIHLAVVVVVVVVVVVGILVKAAQPEIIDQNGIY
jgi:hypothetical protein